MQTAAKTAVASAAATAAQSAPTAAPSEAQQAPAEHAASADGCGSVAAEELSLLAAAVDLNSTAVVDLAAQPQPAETAPPSASASKGDLNSVKLIACGNLLRAE